MFKKNSYRYLCAALIVSMLALVAPFNVFAQEKTDASVRAIKYSDTCELNLDNYGGMENIISKNYELASETSRQRIETFEVVYKDETGDVITHTGKNVITYDEPRDVDSSNMAKSTATNTATRASGTTNSTNSWSGGLGWKISGSAKFGWDGSKAWVVSHSWSKSYPSTVTCKTFSKFSDNGLALIKANCGVDYYFYTTKVPTAYNSGTCRFWCSKTGGISY